MTPSAPLFSSNEPGHNWFGQTKMIFVAPIHIDISQYILTFWVLSAIYGDRVPFELLDSADSFPTKGESCAMEGGQIVFLNLTTIM
jgi:hypothetical protein